MKTFIRKQKNKKQRGFTLIELMVVISIIALLSSVVLSSLSVARASGRDAKRIAEAKQVETALNIFANDYKGYIPYNNVAGSDYSPGLVACSLPASSASVSTLLTNLTLDNAMTATPVDPINSNGFCYYYITGPSVGTITGPAGSVSVADTGVFCYISETKLRAGSNEKTCVAIGVNKGTGVYTNGGYPGLPDVIINTGFTI